MFFFSLFFVLVSFPIIKGQKTSMAVIAQHESSALKLSLLLSRSFNNIIGDLTGKILVFWKSGHFQLQEVTNDR